MRTGSRLSLSLTTLPLVETDALECQLTSCKHSTPVQRPSPRKLSLLNSCVIAGPWPRGAWWWGGVGQVGGVVNEGEALLWDAHCYTDKVVKEEVASCSYSCRTESAYLWHRVCSGQHSERRADAILLIMEDLAPSFMGLEFISILVNLNPVSTRFKESESYDVLLDLILY